MAPIRLKNLCKRFGDVDVIKNVDIEIEDGEFVVFVGPSGCGKSTLLRMIAGLEDITEGVMELDGRVVNELPPRERGVAMVFQNYAIFPHMTVRENIGFGLTIAGTPKREKSRKVEEAARTLQMEHLLDRRPSQLSGGQRQRVAIGRAIVRDPAVFLFDEPLSNLDAALRLDMRMELSKLHRQLGATMVYVTHDQVEAMTLADKVVVLRDGTVQQIGAPMELFRHPANMFVAGFIGSPPMNFLDVQIARNDGDTVTVRSDMLAPLAMPGPSDHQGAEAGGKLGIRPQYLRLAKDDTDALLSGRITIVERLGSETLIDVTLADGSNVIAIIDESEQVAPGETVGLSFDAGRAVLFPAGMDGD